MASRLRWLAIVALWTLAGCAATDRTATDDRLTATVESAIRDLGPDVRAAIWLSSPSAPPIVAIRADEPMPCASSIKAAYLVELFDAFADRLDEPLPGCDVVFGDDDHPAVAHLGSARRQVAQRALGSASVRRIGEAMISGKGVDNATYNIAANVVTAHFGGPAKLTARLHERDASWNGLMVRRYMLADRNVTGDNEVTARSLAAVHAMLADGSAPRVDPRATAAAREILAGPDDAEGRKVYRKGGSLSSSPVTRVRAGWREGPEGTFVHVVLLARDGVSGGERQAAGEALATATQNIEQILLRQPRQTR